jgi:branched-chain amino acid transport system permease protein
MLLQVVLNGIIAGCLYAVVALGFSLIYSSTRIFHIAHGAIYTAAVYLFLAVMGISTILSGDSAIIEFIIALTLTIVFICLLASLFEIIIYRPLLRKKAQPLVSLISSLGIYIIGVNIIALIFGNETKILSTSIEPSITFAGLLVTRIQIIQIIVSVLLIASVFLVLHKTSLGRHIRALSDNSVLLNVLGVNINKIRLIVFILGSILAASASLLKAFDVGVDPHVGLTIVLTSAVAVIVGGIGSHYGAVFAAIMIGIVQNLVVWYTSAQWQDAVTYVILAIVLLVRRKGLVEVKLRLEEG